MLIDLLPDKGQHAAPQFRPPNCLSCSVAVHSVGSRVGTGMYLIALNKVRISVQSINCL